MEESGKSKKRHYYHPKKHNNNADTQVKTEQNVQAQPTREQPQQKPVQSQNEQKTNSANGNGNQQKHSRHRGNRERREGQPGGQSNRQNTPIENFDGQGQPPKKKPEYMVPAHEEDWDEAQTDFLPPISTERKKPSLSVFEPVSKEEYSKPGVIPGPEVLDDIPKISYAALTSENETDEEKVRVIGVQFNAAGKVYYFDPGEFHPAAKSHVIVETARGLEYGEVVNDERLVSDKNIIHPLRTVIRIANEEDDKHNKENRIKEDDAFKICAAKITQHELDMKLVDAQYTFDNSKLLFYFTSAGRVDFRELVKDLAGVFRTRIELRQIGIRDEAKMMGGLGACGRPLCCASFLADFVQVSIKMAKEQNLSLNSGKISGCCGRLMCCLRYEYESYEAELKLLPPVGAKVKTPDGIGFVTELLPMISAVKVSISAQQQEVPVIKTFPKENISVIFLPGKPADDFTEKDSEEIKD